MPVLSRFQGIARFALILLAVTLVVAAIRVGPLIHRESDGRPIAFLWAALKLEWTGTDLVAVTPDTLMQRCCPAPLSKPLTAFMSARGWAYRDQMGGGIIYEKGSERMTATSRMFSRRYVVYRLGQAP